MNIYVKLYLLYVLHKYAVQVLQYKYLIQYFIETHYEICIKLMKLIENDSSFCWARVNRKIGMLIAVWRIPCLQAL